MSMQSFLYPIHCTLAERMTKYMKTWFFREKWQDRKGRWRTAIYAMIAMDGHITEGGSVGEAIHMAHDLIACLKSCPQTIVINLLGWKIIPKISGDYFWMFPV